MGDQRDSRAARAEQDWGAYWRGTGEAGAFSAGGARHPSLSAFWAAVAEKALQGRAAPRVLDVASGNGAVLETLVERVSATKPDITSVDISEAAADNIRQRFPGVRALVADARSMPLEDGGFDLVTSQFGLEYAGAEALPEALRLLAPGGCLALLLHCRDGVIDQECRGSLDAIEAVTESGFVDRALEMFRAGFEAVRGADRAPYDLAAQALAPAAQAVESVVARHGEDVAGGTVAALYADVARIHARMPHYEAGEVLGWLERMREELSAYAGRMAAMTEAALDEAAFVALCEQVAVSGCELRDAGPFEVPGQQEPLAWALVATRPDKENTA